MSHYGVAYAFTLKNDAPQTHAEFIDVWTEMTHIFSKKCGALGSRLHKGSGPHYYAYAQWPSQSAYDKDLDADTDGCLQPLRQRFAQVCEPTKILFTGDIVTDFLMTRDE